MRQSSYLCGLLAGLLLGTCGLTSSASAATYYIDATNGKDTWSGLRQDPTGTPATDGPWQSLSRVGSATLLPGDEVRLRCGQKWGETLRIFQSGTAAAPIRVRPYPDGCTPAPSIDGSIAVPSHNWALERTGVYRTLFPFNVIENGNLTTSVSKWTQWSVAGDTAVRYESTCPGISGGCLGYSTGSGSRNAIASPNFALQGNLVYTLRFEIRATSGTTLTAVIRRGGPTNYDNLGLTHTFTANGSWQFISVPFTALASSPNARFDLYMTGVRTTSWLRHVRLEPSISSVNQVLSTDRPLQPAHHPNAGFDVQNPTSVYLRNNADSDAVATAFRPGSTFITTGPDLALPPGVTLTTGLVANLRSENWRLDRRRVVGVSGSRITLDSPTTYRMLTGWGYFLTGAAWMVDSPDEWFHDTQSRNLTVSMPDASHPSGLLSVSGLSQGVDLNGRSYVVIEGITVRAVSTGISIVGASNVTIRSVRLEHVVGEGIDASGSVQCRIESSTIVGTGLDAIQGKGDARATAREMAIIGNTIYNVGVRQHNGIIVSLPSPALGAVNPGTTPIVSGNRIESTAATAIRTEGGGQVVNNFVADACLVLNDCAGIYVRSTGSGAQITGNLVHDTRGNPLGTTRPQTLAVGIYLDDGANNVVVRGNTVRGSDYGILIHNAYDNLIQDNTLFGTRRHPLWLAEDTTKTRADGDTYRNTISRNTFAPPADTPAVLSWSTVGNVWDFSAFSENLYFALLYPPVVYEMWPTGNQLYTFPEWQTATANGATRSNDVGGRALSSLGYASFRVLGPSVIPNGDLSNGRTGWTFFNEFGAPGTLTLENASVGASLRISAGGSPTLMATPNFSVSKEQWYRVSFDAKTSVAGQLIYVLLRRGGGGTASYEWLMSNEPTFPGSTQWTRYSFVFKPTKTIIANDPATGELGARLDFGRIPTGRVLSVANVEMVPLSSVEVGLRTALLTNPNVAATSDLPCPDLATTPSACPLYVRFTDNVPIVWPYRLAPLGKEIIYTRDPTLLDADRDGIPDSQDRCPSTLTTQAVRSNGCALGQVAQ